MSSCTNSKIDAQMVKLAEINEKVVAAKAILDVFDSRITNIHNNEEYKKAFLNHRYAHTEYIDEMTELCRLFRNKIFYKPYV